VLGSASLIWFQRYTISNSLNFMFENLTMIFVIVTFFQTGLFIVACIAFLQTKNHELK
jgi:hypothetical protein